LKNPRNILFIINPISGVGKQRDIEKQLDSYVDKENYNFEVAYTEYAGHAVEIAQSAVDRDFDIIVAVGGDGSVNEVARGVFGSKAALGIIPTGSGNGLARHLGIPVDIRKAIDIIIEGKKMLIDTASINDELFVSIVGIGFDALVAEKFAGHKQRGFFTYAKIAASEYLFYRSKKFILYIDGQRIKRKAFFISIANAGQFGYNAVISPNALINDGFIDICILKKVPLYAAPFVIRRLFSNSIDSSKYIEIIKAKEVRIIKNIKHKIHIDGDPASSSNELLIRVQAKSLSVVVP
jgi:diacylglycerol kinase (ATP)